jgi:apolipoprotein N-acyltransferase
LLAVYWALTAAAWRVTAANVPWVPTWLSLALLWFAMEWLQAWLFTGFGWSALGYSQGVNLRFAQLASIGGVSLLSAILVAVNAMAAHASRDRRWRLPLLGGAVATVIVVHAVGGLLIDDADYDSAPYHVGVIQPDYPLETKWDREYTLDMVETAAAKSHVLTSVEGPVDLLVWPEAHVMGDLNVQGILPALSNVSRDSEAYLYTGAHRSDTESNGSFNSSFLFDPNGDVAASYDKIHLAPFGEYVPLSDFLPFISKVVPAIGDIEPGVEPKVLTAGDKAIGPLICFEVLFAPMAERLRAMDAEALVVITNLAWFGASNAIPQELEIARLRAIETRLPLIHAANTGVSGVFDPWGRFDDVDLYVGAGGPIRHPDLPRSAKMMERFAGRFPLAAPASRPLPGGPVYLPRAVALLAAAMIIVALIRRRKRRDA